MTKTSFVVDIQTIKCNIFLDAFALFDFIFQRQKPILQQVNPTENGYNADLHV